MLHFVCYIISSYIFCLFVTKKHTFVFVISSRKPFLFSCAVSRKNKLFSPFQDDAQQTTTLLSLDGKQTRKSTKILFIYQCKIVSFLLKLREIHLFRDNPLNWIKNSLAYLVKVLRNKYLCACAHLLANSVISVLRSLLQ